MNNSINTNNNSINMSNINNNSINMNNNINNTNNTNNNNKKKFNQVKSAGYINFCTTEEGNIFMWPWGDHEGNLHYTPKRFYLSSPKEINTHSLSEEERQSNDIDYISGFQLLDNQKRITIIIYLWMA